MGLSYLVSSFVEHPVRRCLGEPDPRSLPGRLRVAGELKDQHDRTLDVRP
jgi:hypothetical protein